MNCRIPTQHPHSLFFNFKYDMLFIPRDSFKKTWNLIFERKGKRKKRKRGQHSHTHVSTRNLTVYIPLRWTYNTSKPPLYTFCLYVKLLQLINTTVSIPQSKFFCFLTLQSIKVSSQATLNWQNLSHFYACSRSSISFHSHYQLLFCTYFTYEMH